MGNDSELDQLLYVFERHRDIELEAGYVLAGILVVDLPRGRLPKLAEAQQAINEIILGLSKMAASGQMPEVAQIFCWKDGKHRPAEITDDQVLINAWAADRLRINVRTSEDGNFTDSEMLQAAGLMPKSGHA